MSQSILWNRLLFRPLGSPKPKYIFKEIRRKPIVHVVILDLSELTQA